MILTRDQPRARICEFCSYVPVFEFALPSGLIGVHCSGRSRGTVSYNRDVAHCFRCGWAATYASWHVILAYPTAYPRKYLKLQEDAIRRARTEKMINVFEAWRQPRICHVSNRFRHLGRVAVRAEEVLRSFPDCDRAWGRWRCTTTRQLDSLPLLISSASRRQVSGSNPFNPSRSLLNVAVKQCHCVAPSMKKYFGPSRQTR